MTDDEKWELPEVLRMTPERLAAADAAQAERRQRLSSPFTRNTGPEIAYQRAALLIPELEAAWDGCDDVERKERLAAQLADALADTGEFNKAAAFAPDKHRQELYADYWSAVWRDDDEGCGCDDDTRLPDAPIFIHVHVEREVWSVKHSAFMPLVRCNKCGFRNVQPPPDVVKTLQAARKQAAANQPPMTTGEVLATGKF
jgi:hypothetical protein